MITGYRHQHELLECLDDLEEHLDLTLRRSVSGLSVLLIPASDPTVMEELVEESVVLEPHHLQLTVRN